MTRLLILVVAMAVGLAMPHVVERFAPNAAPLAPAGQTDLSIGLEPPVSTVRPGERVVFNFRIDNFSRVTARNVVVTVALPQGFTQEPMFSNGFWKSCTTLDAASNAPRTACVVQFFPDSRFAYISIPARAPDASWPLPLVGGGWVHPDTPDFDATNNQFTFGMTVTP